MQDFGLNGAGSVVVADGREAELTYPGFERDVERVFVGDRQIDVRHFYCFDYRAGLYVFSVGYCGHDDNTYTQGTLTYDPRTGECSSVMNPSFFRASVVRASRYNDATE
jgi:hypothetical protein